MASSLASRPRFKLCHLPTPLEPLKRLSAHLGGPQIWVKRDDATGLAFGGNKARKLEFILGDALAKGADLLLTAAGVQSNHARQTAAAAARAGIGCELVLARMVPFASSDYETSGNVMLDKLLGATVEIVERGTDLNAAMNERADRAKRAGRAPYIVPFGGSAPPGTFGYVDAALEILNQQNDAGITFDHVFQATGSGGTQAGLVCGFSTAGSSAPRLHGISVLAKGADYRDKVLRLVAETAAELGMKPPSDDATIVNYEHVGDHYGVPTEAMKDALALAARHEGLILDPVYTGKALAGMIAAIRKGQIAKNETVLFMHTGGTPALFPYREALSGAL